jgi:hypothetical protein
MDPDGKWKSEQDLADHTPENVGQAEIAAFMTPGEPLMIQPKLMEQSGVEIVDMDRFSAARNPSSSVPPYTQPPLTPPPASHME